jgi:predicted TIM-barrel fold metal-dependent hydrolase
MIFDSFENNIFAFKIGAAYSRPIYFESSTFYEAERDFNRILKLNNHDHHKDGISLQHIKAFQDFVYHYCIEKSYDLGIPVQIHTGLLEGNYNNLNNSNPLLITNLLLKYKRVNFDVFHMGYPYFHEIIAMAKMYPNMFVDMCWVSEISNKLYEESLDYVLDLIPSNKVLGFGGDYFFAEGIYGAQKMARMIISEVLAKRVERGDFTHKEAVDYSRKILFENPNMLYQKK